MGWIFKEDAARMGARVFGIAVRAAVSKALAQALSFDRHVDPPDLDKLPLSVGLEDFDPDYRRGRARLYWLVYARLSLLAYNSDAPYRCEHAWVCTPREDSELSAALSDALATLLCDLRSLAMVPSAAELATKAWQQGAQKAGLDSVVITAEDMQRVAAVR